jgi:lysyl-tRNA synthetase class II
LKKLEKEKQKALLKA